MKFKTTSRLFLVVCVLGGLIWLLETRFESTDKQKEHGTSLVHMAVEDANYLMIERNDFRTDCVKRDGVWFLTRPLRARAAEGEIERVLGVIEALPRNEVVTLRQRLERKLIIHDYGLAQPRARFIIGNSLGRKEILLGHDSPIGDQLYVKFAFEEEVLATSRSLLEAIPETVESLRDRTILHGNANRTSRLEIKRRGEGFIQLAHVSGQWIIRQPISARADSLKVTRMLDSLYALEVRDFVWDPPLRPRGQTPTAVEQEYPTARLDQYDLAPDEATARVTVWIKGDRVGKEIILGKEVSEGGNGIFAKRRDAGSIYSTDKEILDAFAVTANGLRDRNILSLDPQDIRYVCILNGDRKLVLNRTEDAGWTIVEPMQWKADDQVVVELIGMLTRMQADSFIDGPHTNLASLGLHPPAHAIVLSQDFPSNEVNGEPVAADIPGSADRVPTDLPGALLFGSPIDGGTSRFVKFANDDCMFRISGRAAEQIEEYSIDPLVYRHRTMLAVPSKSINRISLTKNSSEQTLERVESGTWTAVVPATNLVNRQAVQNVLFVAANMRALRIERYEPGNAAPYGLDRPEVTLTLGLCGEGGIQKSIILGSDTESDGTYAMVQGQDVVFVLDRETARRLTTDLTQAPSPTKAEP